MKLTDEQIRTVTEFASLAPSVHNTQPWQFVATGHRLEVHADNARMLTFLDPTARQLHLSCGAAIEFAQLAIRSLGYDSVVRIVPGGEGSPTLLATITVGRATALTDVEARWIAAAPRRYTDRGAYDDTPVPGDVLTRARDAAADRGCWLRSIDRPGERVTLATLLAKAEELEATDPAYAGELATWRRDAPAVDGIPAVAAPGLGDGRVSDVPLRDFTGHDAHVHPGGGTPPSVEHDTLLLLGSDDDTPQGWLRAGRALALVLLTLTDAGVVTQPLGPVTDVPLTRTRLERELGLLGHAQLAFRAGYGHGAPATGRREVTDVLEIQATGS